MTTIRRIIRSGITNFTRNGYVSLAAISVMVIALFFVGSIIFTNELLSSAVTTIQEKVDINMYFETDTAEEDVLAIKEEIEQLPQVERVDYRSSEEALEILTDNPQYAEVIDVLPLLEENPLGPSLLIKAKESAQYVEIAQYLAENDLSESGSQGIVDEVNYNDNEAAIENLNRIISGVERAGGIIALALLIIAFLITFNTIRLAIFIARQEIHVMRLVGASSFYIRGPFIITGVLYGIVAAVLTLIIFYPVTYWLGGNVSNYFGGFNLYQYYIDNLGQVFLYLALFGVAIGIISSFLAVRKYLRV